MTAGAEDDRVTTLVGIAVPISLYDFSAVRLSTKPKFFIHGERDEILPIEASEMVQMIAGTGRLVRLPGDGHLLAKSDAIVWEHLEEWLPPLVLRG